MAETNKHGGVETVRGGALDTDFTSSLRQDRRLYREEVAVSTAHAKMLAKQGIIAAETAERIVAALARAERLITDGRFEWDEGLEDIHMNIEAWLHRELGDEAGWLHTGRSRNDLVATDTRLYVKRAADGALESLKRLQTALVEVAAEHAETLLPAYTHLQRGQVTVLGHHLLAYYQMARRDAARFRNARELADELPLGSGAATGTPHPLDRRFVADELGFARLSANSLDAVSDRDHIADFIYAGALCMTHLARLAEELVIWSTAEFGFIRLDARYTTGSSIMPQKRNPDFAELVRGRVGRTYGALINLLTTLKGLPLTYNRDLQEDKAPLFETEDTLIPALEAAAGMVRTMNVDAARMRAAVDHGAILATDMADYLVGKGLPFRAAYVAVRQLNDRCRAEGRQLTDLSLEELKQASPLFEADVKQLTPERSAAARNLAGGTAPEQVCSMVERARQELAGG